MRCTGGDSQWENNAHDAVKKRTNFLNVLSIQVHLKWTNASCLYICTSSNQLNTNGKTLRLDARKASSRLFDSSRHYKSTIIRFPEDCRNSEQRTGGEILFWNHSISHMLSCCPIGRCLSQAFALVFSICNHDEMAQLNLPFIVDRKFGRLYNTSHNKSKSVYVVRQQRGWKWSEGKLPN